VNSGTRKDRNAGEARDGGSRKEGSVLRLERVSKAFGSLQAVDDVSFVLRTGTLTVLSGADGAGKSTIMKIILGLVARDAGEIFLYGEPVGREFGRITGRAGYMPERFSLYPDLSVEENLDFFAGIYQVPRRRREEMKARILQKTEMLPFRKRKAGALSGGMKQKLALSAVLLSSPEILILDEPTTGVDPFSRIEFFRIIEELREDGKTILMSTPYLDEADRGDRVIFIKEGRILEQGAIRKLKETFPARLYRILPRGNILEEMEKLSSDPAVRADVYVRGSFIHYLQRPGKKAFPDIPAVEIREESPSLEDIYLYYEREADADRRA